MAFLFSFDFDNLVVMRDGIRATFPNQSRPSLLQYHYTCCVHNFNLTFNRCAEV